MSSRANILLADDEKTIRDLFGRVLAGAGYDVLLAEDGREAIDLARRQHVDVALLDIKMPKIDGIEVLRKIKQVDKEVETIMVTGYASLDTAIAAVKGDACDYLTKPLGDIEDLLTAVGRALDRRKLAGLQKQQRALDKLPVLRGNCRILLLELDEIYYCDAVQHHGRIHCYDRQHLTDFSLGELEKRLEGKLFSRIHRSYLVNLKNVVEIVTSSAQKVHVALGDAKQTKLPVSRYRNDCLKEALGIPSFRSPSQTKPKAH